MLEVYKSTSTSVKVFFFLKKKKKEDTMATCPTPTAGRKAGGKVSLPFFLIVVVVVGAFKPVSQQPSDTLYK